mmetsp:Transcript_14624/g.32526  ORF Transcript_14624/g.32526 Transcript_14624/m.32526 type:complete len:264 (-) Transcript_14624:524-1315(-)
MQPQPQPQPLSHPDWCQHHLSAQLPPTRGASGARAGTVRAPPLWQRRRPLRPPYQGLAPQWPRPERVRLGEPPPADGHPGARPPPPPNGRRAGPQQRPPLGPGKPSSSEFVLVVRCAPRGRQRSRPGPRSPPRPVPKRPEKPGVRPFPPISASAQRGAAPPAPATHCSRWPSEDSLHPLRPYPPHQPPLPRRCPVERHAGGCLAPWHPRGPASRQRKPGTGPPPRSGGAGRSGAGRPATSGRHGRPSAPGSPFARRARPPLPR